MRKVWIGWVVFIVVFSAQTEVADLKRYCLGCHQTQQIPSELIYRRYVLRYGTSERIAEAMVRYLRHPDPSHSIMPPPFFLKFPKKSPSSLDDRTLKQAVKAYISTYDIRKKLRLKR